MPSITVADNSMVADTDGILIYIEGVEIYHEAKVELPVFEISDNLISATDFAFSYYHDLLQNELGAMTNLSPGAVTLSGNQIRAHEFGARFTVLDGIEPSLTMEDNQFLGENGSDNGLYIQNFNKANIVDCRFENWNNSINLNGSAVQVFDISIVNSTLWDIMLENDSVAMITSSEFNRTNVLYKDNLSILEVRWLLDLDVELHNGIPVGPADLLVRDGQGLIIFNGTTNPEGNLYALSCVQYREWQAGILYDANPYNITATSGGITGWLEPELVIDTDLQATVVLVDTIRPWVVDDLSDTTATTGDEFAFSVEVADNFGIEGVAVNYRYGDSGPYSGRVMSFHGNLATYTIPVLAYDNIGPLEYYFTLTDVVILEYNSTAYSVDIIDDEPPAIDADNSDTGPTTGDAFVFRLNATDNVGMDRAIVTYWFGTGTPVTLDLSGTGPYERNLTIPDNATRLYYFFTVFDLSNSSVIGDTMDLVVRDNDRPFDLVDNSDTTATTGEVFAFSVNAADNIGISKVQVVYRLSFAGSNMILLLEGSGPFTGQTTIPVDSPDSLYYYIVITDTSGNLVVLTDKMVTISDNDPPTIEFDTTAGIANVGKALSFSVLVDDNQDISKVSVVYWFENDETNIQTIELKLENGSYTANLIPEKKGTMHYYIEVEDEGGNKVKGTAMTVPISSTTDDDDDHEKPFLVPFILFLILALVLGMMYFKERNDNLGIGQRRDDSLPPRPAGRDDGVASRKDERDDDHIGDDDDDDRKEDRYHKKSDKEYKDGKGDEDGKDDEDDKDDD